MPSTTVQCKCGGRMSKFASMCTNCHRLRMFECARNFLDVAKKGVCEQGHPLTANNSLAGSLWLQCLVKGCGYQILCEKDYYALALQEDKLRLDYERLVREFKPIPREFVKKFGLDQPKAPATQELLSALKSGMGGDW